MRRRRWTSFAVASATLLAGCAGEHPQSALHPASPESREIAWLWWWMLGVCGVVFVIVIALLLFGAFRSRATDARPPGGDVRFVAIGGMLIPGVILIALLLFSLKASVRLDGGDGDLSIEITGKRWWWEVRYPERGIVTANEIHIPAGRPVKLSLWSADVIHSFWAPNLHGKMDLLPERTNTFWIRAEKPGVYRGQCAEFCGVQHAWMAFELVALPEAEFEDWLSQRQRELTSRSTAPPPEAHALFMQVGCGQCHAIRGTSAKATIGPDLTHLGSRRTIGAGRMPNSLENLHDWIVEPQVIKPGNLMPPTPLTPAQADQLARYLQSLR